MSIPPGVHHALRRYLTPFYSFTLGLVFILVASACGREATATPGPTLGTQPANATQVTHRAQFGTQAHVKSSPTLLPAIPATPNERTPSPLGVTVAQLEGQQVKLWYPWKGVTGEIFQAIVDEFNRTNKYGITITANAYEDYGSLDDAMEAAINSGSLPDVVVDYGYRARHWDTSGILTDLAPYVDDPVWGLTDDEQADFISSFWSEDLVADGNNPRRLGIPFYRSAYVLFYNQTWASDLGYSGPPITPEDFRVRACAAAESIARSGDKTSLGSGGWLITSEPGALVGWIHAFGGDVVSPEGEGYLFNNPETIQAFTFLKSLQQSGCAWVDSEADAQAVFANRQALFIVGSLLDIPAQRAAFAQAGSGDEWVVISFPSSQQPVVDTYGPSLLVTRSTTLQQLAAWLVIEWLVYPPNQAEFVQQLGVYPTRQSTLSYLIHTEQAGAQWAQALGLLPEARGEPTLASWDVMRWAVSDASARLFSVQFGTEQTASLVEELDGVAKEIISQVH
ncbi:MAG TPA: extracellular solute-binding protein [Anaerolineales bacterium]|nr:extracellular solute-binding protein [Anaerolineales bacterium]